MIKEALEYINGLVAPTILEINGDTYSDKPLRRIKYIPEAEPIKLTSLTSLVDYISAGIDDMREKMLIHIKSPTQVSFYSCLDKERTREYIAVVNANVPEFNFDYYQEHEAFTIGLQSKFIAHLPDDRDLLLKFTGNVESGTVTNYGDDGVTQKATIRTGVASKSDAIIPSPVWLTPYRTFGEVAQPASQFVFRMKDDKYNGVMCALYEADGGAWKAEAMANIKDYLVSQLGDYDWITIIC